MHRVRRPLAAIPVVVSRSSARKAALIDTTVPSVLTALVHLLNTISAAPCKHVSACERMHSGLML